MSEQRDIAEAVRAISLLDVGGAYNLPGMMRRYYAAGFTAAEMREDAETVLQLVTIFASEGGEKIVGGEDDADFGE